MEEWTQAVVIVVGSAIVIAGVWVMIQVAERMAERAGKRDQQKEGRGGGVQD